MSEPFVIEQKQADSSYKQLIPLGYSNINLLRNGDIINAINQRGYSSYSGDKYCIDGWAVYDGMTFNVTNHTLTGSDASNNSLFYQRLTGLSIGQYYTLSLKVNNNMISTTHILGSNPSEMWENYSWGRVSVYRDSNSGLSSVIIYVNNGTTITLDWVKLEIGKVNTPFIPKGYSVELTECLRYYSKSVFSLQKATASTCGITFPVPMRISPTVTFEIESSDANPTISAQNTVGLILTQSAGNYSSGRVVASTDL